MEKKAEWCALWWSKKPWKTRRGWEVDLKSWRLLAPADRTATDGKDPLGASHLGTPDMRSKGETAGAWVLERGSLVVTPPYKYISLIFTSSIVQILQVTLK